MEGTDDLPPSDGSHFQESVPSSLDNAISNWVHEGVPLFEKMMSELHQSNRIGDPMGQLMIFSVVGGYIHHFSNEWNVSQNLDSCHAVAISQVMNNPAVGQTVEKFMSNQVTDAVGGMLNE